MSVLSIADVLDRAADLIEPEGAWTQGANARNLNGRSVPAVGPNASCFCMAGAVLHVTGGAYRVNLVAAVLPMPSDPMKDPLVAFNDAPERTQAEVVAKLREAAALAREQGK